MTKGPGDEVGCHIVVETTIYDGTGCAIFWGAFFPAENKFWGIIFAKISSTHKSWGVILQK